MGRRGGKKGGRRVAGDSDSEEIADDASDLERYEIPRRTYFCTADHRVFYLSHNRTSGWLKRDSWPLTTAHTERGMEVTRARLLKRAPSASSADHMGTPKPSVRLKAQRLLPDASVMFAEKPAIPAESAQGLRMGVAGNQSIAVRNRQVRQSPDQSDPRGLMKLRACHVSWSGRPSRKGRLRKGDDSDDELAPEMLEVLASCIPLVDLAVFPRMLMKLPSMSSLLTGDTKVDLSSVLFS